MKIRKLGAAGIARLMEMDAYHDKQKAANGGEYPATIVQLAARIKRALAQQLGEVCGFAGCDDNACAALTQTVGKRQRLPVCKAHLPLWATDGTGSRSYLVDHLG